MHLHPLVIVRVLVFLFFQNQRHAALRTFAGIVLHHFRMHDAGIFAR